MLDVLLPNPPILDVVLSLSLPIFDVMSRCNSSVFVVELLVVLVISFSVVIVEVLVVVVGIAGVVVGVVIVGVDVVVLVRALHDAASRLSKMLNKRLNSLT